MSRRRRRTTPPKRSSPDGWRPFAARFSLPRTRSRQGLRHSRRAACDARPEARHADPASARPADSCPPSRSGRAGAVARRLSATRRPRSANRARAWRELFGFPVAAIAESRSRAERIVVQIARPGPGTGPALHTRRTARTGDSRRSTPAASRWRSSRDPARHLGPVRHDRELPRERCDPALATRAHRIAQACEDAIHSLANRQRALARSDQNRAHGLDHRQAADLEGEGSLATRRSPGPRTCRPSHSGHGHDPCRSRARVSMGST